MWFGRCSGRKPRQAQDDTIASARAVAAKTPSPLDETKALKLGHPLRHATHRDLAFIRDGLVAGETCAVFVGIVRQAEKNDLPRWRADRLLERPCDGLYAHARGSLSIALP